MLKLKKHITPSGEILLYNGKPNFYLLDQLVKGPGDLWHSSLDQGYKNCFPELVYQTTCYYWFLNDFENVDQCVNWRININEFAVRASIWESHCEIDDYYKDDLTKGLDLGFSLLSRNFGIPMYIKGLFPSKSNEINVNRNDRYLFFSKHFKIRHSYYMLLRNGLFKFPSEFNSFKKAQKIPKFKKSVVPAKELKPIVGNPTVSLIIPTMNRQAFTELLLKDHNAQTYLIKEAIIVDATPPEERDDKYYNSANFKFEVKVQWQTTKGSCRARNEAVEMCTGDYVIFADDDVRVLPDFVENHIRLLQTYNVSACNGLDIMANNTNEDLTDLKTKLSSMGADRWKVGVSHMFSNANSCVKRDLVEMLKGNDVNFDGGYGEDTDFGLRILKSGEILLNNPFSPNLHLKPPQGGYRIWGLQSRVKGKKRKSQPWELDHPVGVIRPVPSPTIAYGIIKHYNPNQVNEWKYKYLLHSLFKNGKRKFVVNLFKLPLKLLRFNKSLWYAKRLHELRVRVK